MNKAETLTIRVRPEKKQALASYCEEREVSMSFVLNKLIDIALGTSTNNTHASDTHSDTDTLHN